MAGPTRHVAPHHGGRPEPSKRQRDRLRPVHRVEMGTAQAPAVGVDKLVITRYPSSAGPGPVRHAGRALPGLAGILRSFPYVPARQERISYYSVRSGGGRPSSRSAYREC